MSIGFVRDDQNAMKQKLSSSASPAPSADDTNIHIEKRADEQPVVKDQHDGVITEEINSSVIQLPGEHELNQEKNGNSNSESISPQLACSSPKSVTWDKGTTNTIEPLEGISEEINTVATDSNTVSNGPTFFWKSLTFWQRISDSNQVTDVENETGVNDDANTVANDTQVKIKTTEYTELHTNVGPSNISFKSHKSGRSKFNDNCEDTTVLTPQLISPLQPITNITETTIATVNSESRPQSGIDEIAESKAVSNESEVQSSIWDITRRVSYIPFLNKHDETVTAANLETFTPNTISRVTANTQIHIASPLGDLQDNISATSKKDDNGDSNSKETESTSNWWNPFNWRAKTNDVANNALITERNGTMQSARSSDDGFMTAPETGVVEDELLRVQRKEMINQIKIQSYGIPKAKCWAIMRRQADDKYGELVITGNGYKKPTICKKMPESTFETTEKGFNKKPDLALSKLSTEESIVIPDIHWNYRDYTLKTYCRIACSNIPKIGRVFIPQSHLYYDDSAKKKNHSNKKIQKKAVIICFHGFLPQKIVRNIIGESTGTSEEMSQVAVQEMKRWADINNVDISITTINLEGHGKLLERVNACLSILEIWNDYIRNCDYLLSVANSHNVPLAIHTLARLVTSGGLEGIQKLGLIGLSGIFMGPIPEIESKISARGSVGQDNDMISEMFDLEDPDSLQSKELLRNLRIMMKVNFKVTIVGSLNDCFAPLYSTLALHLSHPNIFRAIYIDGADNKPDFLVSLFNLILTVKNLSYSDHGLLIELSSFFNGKIGDGGHSKILKNKYAYRNGISNMLNTSDLMHPQEMREDSMDFREHTTNIYHIPWCLRGFLEELEKLQRHFDVEQMIEQLYEEFKSWDAPEGKEKELWYCMQAFENLLTEDLGL